MDQLALTLKLPPPCGFDRFVVDGNLETLTAVEAWVSGVDSTTPCLYLHGPAGSGKSHLLHAACHALVARGQRLQYLPMGHPGLQPEMLEVLEDCDAVVIDDLESIAGDTEWERALFRLYNALQVAGARLLIAGRAPPVALGLKLEDLVSRLNAAVIYALQPLDDASRARLLSAAAAERGLSLDASAREYILRRCPRDTGALLRLLDALDRLSLERKRAPSVRLIGELLARQSGEA